MATTKPAAKAAPKKTAPAKAAPTKAAPAKAAPKAAKAAKVETVETVEQTKVRLKDLAVLVGEHLPVAVPTIERILTVGVEQMREQYAAGNIIELKDFGKLQIKVKPARPERKGRNPATGEPITIEAKPESRVPDFRFAKAMKELVA